MASIMERALPGYDPDIAGSREKARAIMVIISVTGTNRVDVFGGSASCVWPTESKWSCSPHRGMTAYRGVGPSGRRGRRGGGAAPGRTAIQR